MHVPSTRIDKQVTFAVKATGISLYYLNNGSALHVLDDVSLEVPKGRIVALLGPSGCGKSTILNLLGGILKAEGARIEASGEVERAWDRSAVGKIAYIFQDPALLPWRTIRGNIGLPFEIAGIPNSENRVDQIIADVGLNGFSDSYPREVSGGMRQRVALGRALALEPEFLLVDEPLSSLDQRSREELDIYIRKLQVENGFSVLLVTHNVEEAILVSDNIILLSHRPARVIGDHVNSLPRVRGFETIISREFANEVANLREKMGRFSYG